MENTVMFAFVGGIGFGMILNFVYWVLRDWLAER